MNSFSSPRSPSLILASGSPRRREILARLGYAFEVIRAEVEEWEEEAANPGELVEHNAAIKAAWVAERHRDAVVLAADTTVALDGRIFNKPADLDEAEAMIATLAGRTHTVYTGISLIGPGGLMKRHTVASQVTFRELDRAAIRAYFEVVNPLDKAGAYGIQAGREWIVADWEGSFSNIMGLPVVETVALLTEAGLPTAIDPGMVEAALIEGTKPVDNDSQRG